MSLKDYVPRHLRLGVCCGVPDVPNRQEVVEDIPVVASDGTQVSSKRVVRLVPAAEVMSKYKASAFRLSALIKAGVPIDVVNINRSNSASIDELLKVCQSVDGAEKYIARVEAERKERESWFKGVDESFVENETEEMNEIY